jgi:hypothetical protein
MMPFGEGGSVLSTRVLRHYKARLRHSQRMQYRIARHLVVWLPVVLFLLGVVIATGSR